MAISRVGAIPDPPCFGKPAYFDEVNDEDCRTCHARVRCKVQCRQKKAGGSHKKNTSLKNSKATGRGDRSVAADDEDAPTFRVKKKMTTSWFGALKHNSFIRLCSTFFRELAFGVEQIPLEPYSEQELEEIDE